MHDVTLASLEPSEGVHSPVAVLGDRSILHKSLNRNLLALGYTLRHGDAVTGGYAAGGGEGVGESSVHVSLLDGVSGAVVHAYAQPRATGPLQLALTENTLVVAARALPSGMGTLSVVELFENATAPSYARMLLAGTQPLSLCLQLLCAWVCLLCVCLSLTDGFDGVSV